MAHCLHTASRSTGGGTAVPRFHLRRHDDSGWFTRAIEDEVPAHPRADRGALQVAGLSRGPAPAELVERGTGVWNRRRDEVPREVIDAYQQLQRELAAKVEVVPLEREPRLVAAVDVHLRGDRGIAAVVSMRYPELDVQEERWAEDPVDFPYIPGLLSFREAPLCLKALGTLDRPPDLILVDGQGRAHPRRFGLACHLGVETGIPAIGDAKSVLTGRYGELGEEKGSTAELVSRREVVGMAVRTRDGVSPLIVSVGNRITLPEAVEWTLRMVTRYRMPEPSRRAHLLAKRLAAGGEQPLEVAS